MDMCNVIKNYNFKKIYKFSNLLEKLDLQFANLQEFYLFMNKLFLVSEAPLLTWINLNPSMDK